MILKKKETDKQTNILIGQENVLNEKINYIRNEIEQKKDTLKKLKDSFNESQAKIKQLEEENKKAILIGNSSTRYFI